MAGGDAYLADAPPLPGQLGTQQLNGKAVDGRSREGAVATIMEGSQDSGTTTTSSEVMMNERYNELERLGLVGEHTTSLWIGNIPESSSSEEAIRLLFGEFVRPAPRAARPCSCRSPAPSSLRADPVPCCRARSGACT